MPCTAVSAVMGVTFRDIRFICVFVFEFYRLMVAAITNNHACSVTVFVNMLLFNYMVPNRLQISSKNFLNAFEKTFRRIKFRSRIKVGRFAKLINKFFLL